MRGPWHDFLVVDEDEFRSLGYMGYVGPNPAGAVKVADDVLRLIGFMLQCVPTRNPSNEKEWQGHGLNMYGPTLIEGEGAKMLADVFDAWANLFATGPEVLSLPAGLVAEVDSEEGGEQWQPYHIQADRDGLVTDFKRIAGMGREAAAGRGLLLHLGI